MISPLNIVLEGIMLMLTLYPAGRDESMEVALHVVTQYVSTSFLQQKEGTSKPLESEFSWTTEEVAQAQHNDPDLSSAIARMEEGKAKPSPDELCCLSPVSRAIWAQHQLLELKDNVLRLCPKVQSRNLKPRIILPESLVKPAVQRPRRKSPWTAQNTVQSSSQILETLALPRR